MEKWLRESLSKCLQFEVPDDMLRYIMAMKSYQEFDEYFDTLLSKDCAEHRKFLADCKQRLFNKNSMKKENSSQSSGKSNKSNNRPITSPMSPTSSITNKSIGAGSAKLKQQQSDATNTTTSPIKNTSNSQGAKKKTKYVNLYTNDGIVAGNTILLKGRRVCYCEATEHKLINNCLECGRIVCEQEGSGPCLFCGAVVCSEAEKQTLNSATGKKRDSLLKSLQEKGGGESLRKALEQRDRLLEYDRNSEKRTTVIDDEFDYFDENSVWQSEEQRAHFQQLKDELHEQKHGSRSKRKITVDFAGRPMEDEAELIALRTLEDRILGQVNEINKQNNDGRIWSQGSSGSGGKSPTTTDSLQDPNMEAERPRYWPTAEEKIRYKNQQTIPNDGLEVTYNRVQDKELLEMQDMRQCISLHQPWASLLVAGIKKHEGRVWYSGHRGRLWIASTAKEPKKEDIENMELFYKNIYNDEKLKFPEFYPSGCLLGCVQMDDCLPQEEYNEIYPCGESDSPYVFICSNPQQLPVVIPIKGQQKIYQLDPVIHNTASKALLRLKSTNGQSI